MNTTQLGNFGPIVKRIQPDNCFYGWVNTGNQRIEIYKAIDGRGDLIWTSIKVWTGDPFGENFWKASRIASECVTGYDSDPDFNRN